MNVVYPWVRLKPQRPERLNHPWVFAGEIEDIADNADPGSVVRVSDARGRFLGMAMLNPRSKITLRYLTARDEAIDALWWEERITQAIERRRRLPALEHTNALRLINAEADGLPALIVDRYADVLVFQMPALGLEPWREVIVRALWDRQDARTIWERSDLHVRELEGLEQRSGLAAGAEPPPLVEVVEGTARLLVDVRQGQKTGMFLDQRRNRQALGDYVEGGRVLNCFSYSGGFGVHAGLAGAGEVINVDSSSAALDLAEQNMALNGLEPLHRPVEANCFDLLRRWSDDGERFDLVVLDPPAFTKSRAAVPGALRGYKEINLRAMRMLNPMGILVTCSCSQHIDDLTFKAMLAGAAADARRELRILEQRGQGPDHPELPRAPETHYLTCIIAEVE
jgi:23S rRNA (cytosine1962-C5)-methyltransferase